MRTRRKRSGKTGIDSWGEELTVLALFAGEGERGGAERSVLDLASGMTAGKKGIGKADRKYKQLLELRGGEEGGANGREKTERGKEGKREGDCCS